ncbi:MAG: hypothetical protein QW292_10445 [Candidatus Parvarchaeota archaeon]
MIIQGRLHQENGGKTKRIELKSVPNLAGADHGNDNKNNGMEKDYTNPIIIEITNNPEEGI